MELTLREVLFIKVYNGNVLFKSQIELAKKIFKEGKGFKSLQSIKTSLNQTLAGNRSISLTLKKGILAVIESENFNSAVLQEVRDDLKYVFNTYENRSSSVQKPRKNSSQTIKTKQEFRAIINTPGHHVMITDNPIELLESDISDQIIQDILKKVHAYEPHILEKFPLRKEYTFEYYVKDRDTSTFIWKRFYGCLLNHVVFPHKEVQEVLTKINKLKYLRVFATKPFIASHNLYLHNIKTLNPKAFRVYNHRTHIERIPNETTADLLDNLYVPLKASLRTNGIVMEDKYGYRKAIKLDEPIPIYES